MGNSTSTPTTTTTKTRNTTPASKIKQEIEIKIRYFDDEKKIIDKYRIKCVPDECNDKLILIEKYISDLGNKIGNQNLLSEPAKIIKNHTLLITTNDNEKINYSFSFSKNSNRDPDNIRTINENNINEYIFFRNKLIELKEYIKNPEKHNSYIKNYENQEFIKKQYEEISKIKQVEDFPRHMSSYKNTEMEKDYNIFKNNINNILNKFLDDNKNQKIYGGRMRRYTNKNVKNKKKNKNRKSKNKKDRYYIL